MTAIAPPWWDDEEADFWLAVETAFVDQYAGSASGATALFRGSSGERVLRRLRRARPQAADNPQALARAATAFSVTG